MFMRFCLRALLLKCFAMLFEPRLYALKAMASFSRLPFLNASHARNITAILLAARLYANDGRASRFASRVLYR